MKKNLTLIYLVVSCIANAQGVWTQKANFGGAGRTSAVGFSIGGKGYIGTGYSYNSVTGNQYYKDFWEWDQFTDVWTQKADFGGGSRNFAVGFSIGGKGYIGTGKTSGSFYDFWEWDQSTNIWMQKADFGGGARAGAVGFSIGTKGYIGTGDGGGYKKDFWEWDQATNIWSQKVDFAGTARWSACGFAIGAKGYIGTGYDGVKKQDFWEWDQISDTWAQKANFGGVIRNAAVGFSIGAKGYIGAGQKHNPSSATAINDFWEWDQITDTWTQQVNYGGYGGAAAGFSIGNKGYIGTGGDGYIPIYQKVFWEYWDGSSVIGIDEVNKIVNISAFPNPSNGKFTLQMDNATNCELSIFNVAGEKVYSAAVRTDKIEIDLGPQSKGIYFCKVILENGRIAMKKVIIQ